MGSPEPEQFQDPYLDPGTGLLRNKTGLTDQDALDRFEAERSEVRGLQLRQDPVPFTGDLHHLQTIHGHLFQDVYDWAGQLRTVDIRKPGGQPFLPVSLLGQGTDYAFAELRADEYLVGAGREEFVDRLAHHYDQVNHAHPFREGNGRTQRVFFTQVAQHAGYDLNWAAVTGERNDYASKVAADRGDNGPLRDMFADITVTRSAGRSSRQGSNAAGAGPDLVMGSSTLDLHARPDRPDRARDEPGCDPGRPGRGRTP